MPLINRRSPNFALSLFQIQMTTLCVSISLSAYVTLFCLFSPKIYIIIFHPDKNIRKLTMNSNTYRKPTPSSGITYFPTSSNPGNDLVIDFISLAALEWLMSALKHSLAFRRFLNEHSSSLVGPLFSLVLQLSR